MSKDKTKSDRPKIAGVFPFYPLLFGLYPAVALAAHNISQIDLSTAYRSFLFSALLAVSLLGLSRLFMRSWMRAAFFTLLLLILFYSYGHLYSILKAQKNSPLPPVRHRYMMLIWLALAVLAGWICYRKAINYPLTTSALNILSIFLLIIPLFQIGQYELKIRSQEAAATVAPTSQGQQSRPDIYYIILDAHMRSDNIQAVYGFDNSAFIDALKQRGFTIPACTQSNYATTLLSLASSLNMNYLDKLGGTTTEQVYALLSNNFVRNFLESQGYKVVAFETGYRWTQWENADVYYKYHPDAYMINPFESLFLQTTMIRMPLDEMQAGERSTGGLIQHNRIVYDLNILKQLPTSVQGPKFVFAHLVIPHPPFVYGPNGEFVSDPTADPENIPGYRNAVTYIDGEILQVVDRILADSKTPPVIVIQGDHGALFVNEHAQKVTILNAYYLPGVTDKVYSTITPVNTFRIILDAYFGQNYPLLDDISRYSPYTDRFNYELIPNQCNP